MGRKQASTDDATAERFLANGWEALRDRLGYGDEVTSRSLSDIPLFTGIGPTLAVGEDTTGAFYRRWPNREAYLEDLLDYALDETRLGGADAERTRRLLETLASRPSFSELVAAAATAELEDLHRDPWLGLQLRLWPDARHQGRISEQLRRTYEAATDSWELAYDMVVGMYRLSLRDEMTTRRLAVLLTALVDGLAIRKVIDPDAVDDDLMPDGVQAMVLGILEHGLETAGLTVGEALDAVAADEE